MNKKFCIVIPYYSKYDAFLDDCLLSVFDQTLFDFECLIVSTAEEFRTLKQHGLISDCRCKCILTEKVDQSSKRNAGIRQSDSLYITFLDCDDYLDTKFLEKCNDILNDFEYDMIAFNITRNDKEFGKYSDSIQAIKDVDKLKSFIFSKYMSIKTPTTLILDSGCAKIFRTDILKKNDIFFIEDMSCAEDAVFVRRYSLFIKTICLCDNSYPYYWRVNPFSTMNNLDSPYYNLESYCREMVLLFQNLPEKYYDDFSRHICSLFAKRIRTAFELYFNNKISNKELIRHIKKNYSNIQELKQVLNKRSFDEKPLYLIWLLIKHRLFCLFRIVVLLSKYRHKHTK